MPAATPAGRPAPERDEALVNDDPALLLSGAHTGTGKTALSQPGDATSVRGRRLARAPKSDNETIYSRLSDFWWIYPITYHWEGMGTSTTINNSAQKPVSS